MLLPTRFLNLTFVFILIAQLSLSQTKSIHIELCDMQPLPSDTIYVQVWDEVLASGVNPTYRLFKSHSVDGRHQFNIPMTKDFVRVSMSKVKRSKTYLPFIQEYLIEAGDNIVINTGKLVPTHRYRTSNDSVMNIETLPNIFFSGKGASESSCQRDLLQFELRVKDSFFRFQQKPRRLKDSLEYVQLFYESPENFQKSVDEAYFIYNGQLEILNRYKKRFSSANWNILLADIASNANKSIGEDYFQYYALVGGRYSSVRLRDSLRNVFQQIFSSNKPLKFVCYNSAITYSSKAIEYLLKDAFVQTAFNYEASIGFISRNYKGVIRDKILTSFFLSYFPNLKSQDSLIRFALRTVQSYNCLSILTNIRKNQLKGSDAFPFTLPDINGKMISLHSFRGKVVFLDFWYTGCPGCRQFYEADVQYAENYFKDSVNIVFITISIDQSSETWKRSVAQKLYTSDLALNLYTAGKGADHPVITQYAVLAYPRPILIGKDGRIFSNSTTELRSRTMKEKGKLLIDSIKKALDK